ncbi:amidohydrolase [Pseudogracilibacillus sp. SO30301A]|uniref:amidohydrolase n=1 Tax=Pseudogracilibacillus sp. SO30301A TaxID=3098291 RepID=UPI00300E3259
MTKIKRVFLNGRIYCIVPRESIVEALLVKNGKIEVVGSNEEIKRFITPNTEVIDLQGKTVIPGLQEMHIHAITGAYQKFNECQLPQDSSNNLDKLLEIIAEFSYSHPDLSWITGNGWSGTYLSQIHKFHLDKIDSSRPMFLLDFSIHNAWVNSRALAIAGIDKHTPDPEGGEIVRDEQGNPTGLLVENAVKLVQKFIPKPNEQDFYKSGEWVVEQLNSYGITGIKDPLADDKILDVYRKLEKNNKLSIRVGAHLPWKSDLSVGLGEGLTYEDQFNLIKNRDQFKSNRINPNYAKIFLDGVPHFKTAAFLEPYEGESTEEYKSTKNLLVDPEELKQDLIKLDSEGITVKMHATGDAAVRTGLDAIQAARKHNGFSGLLHEITHTGFVSDDDKIRFKELNAIAEFSPAGYWSPSTAQDIDLVNAIGRKRANTHYEINSIKSTGALVVYGSDWPVVPSINPWPAIEALVTRENTYEDYPGVLNINQAIEIVDAIEMCTINGAWSMSLEGQTGSIEVGKYADMIILDRDIFEINPKKIRNTIVLETIVEGESVYTYDKVTE